MPPTNHHEPATNHHEAEPLDLLPGEPPLRVTHALTSTPLDPPPGTELFTGLTPRLAAAVLATYTRPGDVVIDATADLAVEGTARAGARNYYHLALPPESDQASTGPSLPLASLVLLRWPVEPPISNSDDDGDQIAGPPTSEGALARVLRVGRKMARPEGHLVVVLERPADPDVRELSRWVIDAARAGGMGGLRHVVVVTASGRCGRGADYCDVVPPEGPPSIGGQQICRLLFVMSAGDGGDHG